MKTTFLLLSTDSLFANRMISQGAGFDVVNCESVLSAVNYTQVCKNTLVVIYDAHSETQTALKYIRFLIENIRKDILFFVIAKRANQVDELFVKGVNDVFTCDVEVENIYLQTKLFMTENYKQHVTQMTADIFIIPGWKRAFDIIFSFCALVALLPFFLLIVIAIRIESKGKVFYASKRVGTGYRIFDFYKFRSMYTGADKRVDTLLADNQYGKVERERNAEENRAKLKSENSVLIGDEETITEELYLANKKANQENSFFKMANDPRITKVGRLLRNTSIDELPQLVNILKGEMSVVGNRPLPLYEAEMLTNDKWAKRFLAPAGLTGLWQVTKRGNANAMSADERKQLDIDYVDTLTFKGDLSIIIRTIPALIQHENV